MIKVKAGVKDHTSSSGQTITASQIFVHPNYNPNTSDNDIALILLSAPLSFNNEVQPVAFSTPCNTPATAIQNGTITTLSGWGRTVSSTTSPVSQFLKKTTMPIIANSAAYGINTSYSPNFNRQITSNMIAFSQSGTGAAPGDSGVPATIWINGIPIVIGVCSWGYYPKDQLPTIYTKVSNYESWIKNIIYFSPTTPSLDLFTKDNAYDIGYVDHKPCLICPTLIGTGGNGDKSPDIWVRNQQDGFTNQSNQNPEFQNSSSVYVYVRVRNKSCVSSTGNEQLSLYWSKASGWSSWPQNWDGTQPTTGNKVGTQNIPVLQPGQSTILEFPWTMLNPHQNNTWNSCLLSRIENSTADPITVYPNRLDKDISLNNNISLRNVTVTDIFPGKSPPYGGPVLIGNPLAEPRAYNIRLQVPNLGDSGTTIITQEAEVRMKFDSLGWAILEGSGQLNQEGITILRDRQIIVHQPDIILRNVAFAPEVRIPIEVTFNFLMDEITENTNYEYVVSQSFAESPDTTLGWETFIVNKTVRQPFDVNAGGDKAIKSGESVVLSPNQFNEIVAYNWYDEYDELIYTGRELAISPEMTTKYKLEVISSLDGFKDYDEVNVEVKKFYLTTIAPNPATANISIGYIGSYLRLSDGNAAVRKRYA